MVTLGLAPPYAIEDIHQAYREKAKRAHPDRGGSVAEFIAIQQAFERAQAYMEYRTDRRAWIAGKMARYVALEQAIARVSRCGVSVVTLAPAWLQQSYGDFAQLTETPAIARAENATNGDAIIAALVDDHVALRELESLELPGCRVSDNAVLRLATFPMLRRLDLSRTPVTRRVLALVDELPQLESLDLEGSRVGWWLRRRTAARLRRRAAAEPIPVAAFRDEGALASTVV
jgi:hypothetical protein